MVEDDDSIGDLLVQAFTQETSHQALLVTDGVQALEAAGKLKPDLFIIDYLLPGMNGLQLFDHLQSLETFEQVPTIMITVATMTEDIQAVLRDRSVALITKPLDLADLLDYLEYLHKNSHQQLL